MTTQFDTVREALNILRGAVGHEENIHTADIALAALAELERTHYTAEDVADASAQGFRDGVASVTAGLEPVAWQRRMRPTWGSHAAYPWSPWEPCTKEQADDHWKTPLLHEWAYEARALYTAAPVAQQPQEIEVQCPVCNHKFHEWPNDKQPQAEAVPVVDRVYEAAKRLVDHADFQLGGVLSAKSKARDIPSNAASKVKARHLASLRDALAKTPQQAEAVPQDVFTHRDSWRSALTIAHLTAKTPDDRDYWAHEIKAFDRTFDALAAAPQPKEQSK